MLSFESAVKLLSNYVCKIDSADVFFQDGEVIHSSDMSQDLENVLSRWFQGCGVTGCRCWFLVPSCFLHPIWLHCSCGN